MARYLPAAVRRLVLADLVAPGAWAGECPDDDGFIADTEAAAAAAGAPPYPLTSNAEDAPAPRARR